MTEGLNKLYNDNPFNIPFLLIIVLPIVTILIVIAWGAYFNTRKKVKP